MIIQNCHDEASLNQLDDSLEIKKQFSQVDISVMDIDEDNLKKD